VVIVVFYLFNNTLFYISQFSFSPATAYCKEIVYIPGVNRFLQRVDTYRLYSIFDPLANLFVR
jgi:hypothetical protein